MLIFVGAVIMILGVLGCCGAMKENRFMMILVSFPNSSQYPAFRLWRIISHSHYLSEGLVRIDVTLSLYLEGLVVEANIIISN